MDDFTTAAATTRKEDLKNIIQENRSIPDTTSHLTQSIAKNLKLLKRPEEEKSFSKVVKQDFY